MGNTSKFTFKPLPPIRQIVHFPFPPIFNPLGPLASLAGDWGGTGFNMIWRPHMEKAGDPPNQDRFLELNLTNDSISFEAISGPIPNRGLLQKDINMFGLTYTQQVSDANLDAGLHVEPGIWAVVPATTNPGEGPTVVRMASIPHGTTMLAQGTASTSSGPPAIPVIGIKPFPVGNPNGTFNFPEQKLNIATNFRSPPAQIVGITQPMVDDPNSVLRSAISGQHILSTTTLHVSTAHTVTHFGGGTSNTAFLAGGPSGPNALAATVDCTFWIELVQGTPDFLQLQYSQNVSLDFNGLTWPHITVGTLRKHVPVTIPPWVVDPGIPASLLKKAELPVIPELGVRPRTMLPEGILRELAVKGERALKRKPSKPGKKVTAKKAKSPVKRAAKPKGRKR